MRKTGTSAPPTGTCAVTGAVLPEVDLVHLGVLRPAVAALVRRDHPELDDRALISRPVLARYRQTYIEDLLRAERGELGSIESAVVESLTNYETIAEDVEKSFGDDRTLGERLSDRLATFGGSWTFIILFGVVLVIWMGVNVAMATRAFDPYPFILLNLVLSCIAALQAPVIMMSQKRQESKDRLRSLNDYRVNLKAELEIRHLHEKIDHLIHRQWERLAEIQAVQLEVLEEIRRAPPPGD